MTPADDLFAWREQAKPAYPDEPGFKEATTSKDAAEAMKPRSSGLRDRALACLALGPATPDEIAHQLGESVLAIRPRITELRLLGQIEKTGERRANESGLKAHVWRLITRSGSQ